MSRREGLLRVFRSSMINARPMPARRQAARCVGADNSHDDSTVLDQDTVIYHMYR